MEVNYCPSCGEELRADSNFCRTCGAEVGLDGDVSSETAGSGPTTQTESDSPGSAPRPGATPAGEPGQSDGSRRRAYVVAFLMLPATVILFMAGVTIQSAAGPGPGGMTGADWYHWFGWPIVGIGLFSLPLVYGHLYRKIWAYRLTTFLYGAYLLISLGLILVGSTMGSGYGRTVVGFFNVPGLILAIVVLVLVFTNEEAYATAGE